MCCESCQAKLTCASAKQGTQARCRDWPAAGIYNDLGSGSNVDLCIITKGKVDYLRNYEFLQGKTYSRQKPVIYSRGLARESSALPASK